MPDKLTRNTAGAAMSAASGFAARDKYVYRVLLDRADNVSADGTTLAIPDRMQPGAQDDRKLFGVSRSNVQRALRHLKRHGWVTSVLRSQGSEGRPPCHYTLMIGTGCDCPVKHQVKHQGDAQLGPSKASGKASETTEYSVSVKRQTAGQDPFSAKGKEGTEGKGPDSAEVRTPAPALCDVCRTPMDPVLPRCGYRTHPCCDPFEKPDRSTDLSPRRPA